MSTNTVTPNPQESLLERVQARLKKIDSSKSFQAVIIAVILLSALLIGVKTHNIPEKAIVFLVLMDSAVMIFFVIVIVYRNHQTLTQRGSLF
jgi:voltage-gated sodium channel